MIVKCFKCGAEFEDMYRSWWCPHAAFAANDGNNNFSIHEEAHLDLSTSYDADYYLRGKQTGRSLYENYRWMPELTVPMARAILKGTGISGFDKVLDFGCARGYLVKALRLLGVDAGGMDISKWAIENADEETKPYLMLAKGDYIPIGFDWIIAKDVLEHVPYVDHLITRLMDAAVKGVFAVVPLSPFDGSGYVIEEYEADVTHVQRHTLGTWVNMFLRPGWTVEASYRMPGVKDNYYKPGWERGNGFITCCRIIEE